MAHHKSSNPDEFILPDLGEGVHEAELIKWRVKPGQVIKEMDILAEMETDKALVEVPSPRAGTIRELFGKEGEILHVGNPLVSYEGAGAAAAASGVSSVWVKTKNTNGPWALNALTDGRPLDNVCASPAASGWPGIGTSSCADGSWAVGSCAYISAVAAAAASGVGKRSTRFCRPRGWSA